MFRATEVHMRAFSAPKRAALWSSCRQTDVLNGATFPNKCAICKQSATACEVCPEHLRHLTMFPPAQPPHPHLVPQRDVAGDGGRGEDDLCHTLCGGVIVGVRSNVCYLLLRGDHLALHAQHMTSWQVCSTRAICLRASCTLRCNEQQTWLA
jgi:hypothetical protein